MRDNAIHIAMLVKGFCAPIFLTKKSPYTSGVLVSTDGVHGGHLQSAGLKLADPLTSLICSVL